MNAYHLFIQLGFIAHGLMQYLSIHHHQLVWKNFSTWLRTIRDNTLPSEKVVSLALGRSYIEFLIDDTMGAIFKKFLRRRTDISQLRQCNFEQKKAARKNSIKKHYFECLILVKLVSQGAAMVLIYDGENAELRTLKIGYI